LKLSRKLAIAVDIGTTTVAVSLVDLATSSRLAVAGGLNPQRQFGADVIARLQAATASDENLRTMQRLINVELQRLVAGLLHDAGATMADLAQLAVAGNPAMEHLLLGLPVRSLAFPPYRPLFKAGRSIFTRELGWADAIPLHVFPLPGGFVGGDLVAFLYGCSAEPAFARPPAQVARLFLDIGTNGEIALAAGGKVYATSVAAGPALEGGNLACGMAALPGAISRVAIAGEKVTLTTIGGAAPAGICGSAVIDAVAELLVAGVIDHTGRLLSPGEIPSNLANRLTTVAGESSFVLYRDAARLVYLSQQDIRQVQLAKGAIAAGIEILLGRAAICHEDLQEVLLTGSFGAELAPHSLKNVGIFAGKMVKIARFVREGALTGVEKALCATQGMAAVEQLAESLQVIPLSGTPAFEKLFLAQLDFPKH